jgi:UDP-N-acetylglucosamine 2-epimerase
VAPTPKFNGTRIRLIDIAMYLPATAPSHSFRREMRKSAPVRVLLVANSAQIDGLDDAAEAAEIVVERWREDRSAADGDEEIGAIAAALREFEAVLTGADRPDAVVVASDSSASLAAVIVATKIGTPVARLSASGSDPDGTNCRLIRQLADSELAREPAAIADWARDTYTARA